MKSAKLINGEVKIVDVEKPELSGFGAIVRVKGCGLCGSDIVKIREGNKDAVLGHEIVGEIVEINSSTDFKVGDNVVVAHHYPCFECEFCRNESYSMCPVFKASNVYPAGFSEFILIDEGHLKNTVFKLSEGIGPVSVSFMEPLGCCERAVRRASLINPRANVLSLGLGSIGLLMAQCLRTHGFNSYGFDINPMRQEFARGYNIEFNPDIKYDAVFMTSGSAKAISSALSLIKDGGKVVVFASVEDPLSAYTNNEIYYRELSIIGSYSPAPIDLKIAYSKILSKEVKLDGISTVYSLQDIQKAIDDTLSGKIYKAYIEVSEKI